jgi:hypothetical protein
MAQKKAPQNLDEKAFVTGLKEKAAKRTPNPQKFKQAKRYTDTSAQSDRFENLYGKSSIDGRPIHHFHYRGEFVVGILGECEGEIYGPSSYPFALDTYSGSRGAVETYDPPNAIRLPGNRRLVVAIHKADALYQRVKITYLGKLYAKTRRYYEKVFRIEAAPLDKEPTTPAGRTLIQNVAKDAIDHKRKARAQ